MRIEGKVPPTSEAGFRRKYTMLWTIAGATCVLLGLIIGPRLNHSRNPWLSIVVAFAVYVISLLVAPLTLMRVWTKPAVTPAVLYFSIPVGVTCIVAMLVFRRLATSLLFPDRELLGLALALSLLYAAALIWGIAVGIRRKQMGDFNIGRRVR
jgi:hypothetical protein